MGYSKGDQLWDRVKPVARFPKRQELPCLSRPVVRYMGRSMARDRGVAAKVTDCGI